MIGRYDGIRAHQRDVGAVQRGDVGQAPRIARVITTEHLPRQHGAHRMWNSVMHVQQVELVDFGNLGHACRQRQVVRRILEQRIPRNFDLVIVNVGLRLSQPDGLRVRNEVDFMAALRQFESELRGDHTAAAVSGITRYTDSHGFNVEADCKE